MIDSIERSDLYCMIFCTQYCKKTTWILSLIPSLELFTFVIPGPFIADYSVLAVLIFKGLVVTKSSTSFCTIEERCLNWQLYMYNIFLFLDKMIGYYLITLCACDKSNHLYHVFFFFFCTCRSVFPEESVVCVICLYSHTIRKFLFTFFMGIFSLTYRLYLQDVVLADTSYKHYYY